MAQKVNPIIHRIPVIDQWRSAWFSGKRRVFGRLLEQDTRIRSYMQKSFKDAGLDRVEIERSPDQIIVNIFTSKPGVIIGRSGAGIEKIKVYIRDQILKGIKTGLQINIKEVNKPQLSSSIMVRNIAADLEKRIPYRRTIKRALDQIDKAGARGAKIEVKGKLDGREIARKERVQSGGIPLQTLRANVDYSRGAAFTSYGAIGIKVWIYKGEVFSKRANDDAN